MFAIAPILLMAITPLTQAPVTVDESIIRKLVAALKDPEPEVRQNLGFALAKIGLPTVELLTEALKDALPERRAGAAYALGLIGVPARVALPSLLDLLNDPDATVRRQASYAIGRVIPAQRSGGSP